MSLVSLSDASKCLQIPKLCAVINRNVRRNQIWSNKIRFLLLKELDFITARRCNILHNFCCMLFKVSIVSSSGSRRGTLKLKRAFTFKSMLILSTGIYFKHCFKTSMVVHNNNACRSAGAEIYPGWSCFPHRCTECMEQCTIISSNCFLPRSIQTPAEDISNRPQFWLTFTNFSLLIIL